MSKQYIFTTDAFLKKTGHISPIIEEFTTPDYFLHYHVTMHEGCTQLGEWAKKAIRETERPVLYITKKGRAELLPEYEFPSHGTDTISDITCERLIVHLDRLPVRYEHAGAQNGGQFISASFMSRYKNQKKILSTNADAYGFSDAATKQLAQDPSILTGAQLSVFPGKQVWNQTVHYAMKKLGIWDDSFLRIGYSEADNCMERYPTDFNYQLLIPVMNEFGGWIDFQPGRRDQSAPGMTCNFTTCGKDEHGMLAIVHVAAASADKSPTPEQKRFVEKAYEAFGI